MTGDEKHRKDFGNCSIYPRQQFFGLQRTLSDDQRQASDFFSLEGGFILFAVSIDGFTRLTAWNARSKLFLVMFCRYGVQLRRCGGI
jgi:hypothetical protein